MKKIPFSILILLSSFQILAQVIYVSSTDNLLYQLDINTCNYEFVVEVQADVSDITFHPNGNLYGISGFGELYRIDTLSGAVFPVFDFSGQNFNSLTASGDGLIYALGSQGLLWSFDIANGVAVYHGDTGYIAAGDLTFYNGELYAAIIGDRIALVDIDDPPNTSIIIDQDVPGSIYGIVSFAEDCSNINTYAITNGDSDIYQIDYVNDTLIFICELDIDIGGGASSVEFNASDPITVNDLNISLPFCNLFNGEILIAASGGIGSLTYSIDGLNFQENGNFENLNSGQYTVSIRDENDCTITEEVELTAPNSPEITNLTVENVRCADNNGSIEVFADSGTGQLEYSLDGMNFQVNNVFENLQPDIYTIVVIDETSCIDSETIEILNIAIPSISLSDLTNTTCDEDNGLMQVEASGGTSPYNFSIDGSNFQPSNNFENLTAGEFTVFVQDMDGCQDSLSVIIQSSESPQIESINTTTTNCGEDNGFLLINGIGSNGILQYSSNGIDYQESNVFENVTSGEYTIYIKDEAGCISTEIANVEGSDKLLIQNIEITSSDCGEDNGRFVIETNGGNERKTISLNGGVFQSDFIYSDLVSDIYHVQIVDESGCTLDTTIFINQRDCPIYIPNVFSPNEDGVNDQFSIYPHPDFVGDFTKLVVFDRWGSVVFNANDFNPEVINWDGTYDGRELEVGVYSFYLEYVIDGNIKRTRTGDVTLLKI